MRFVWLTFILFILGCKQSPKKEIVAEDDKDTTGLEIIIELPDSAFVSMNRYAEGFYYDMKYATADNFLDTVVYDCADCLLRKEVADALIQANEEFVRRGFRIKFFDCYRPVDVQKIMWDVFPNPGYVANPYTSGSIHNRGGAVDITLVDPEGNELDMGTPFDSFEPTAHHSYKQLPDTVLKNRQLLKSVMESYAFSAIRTEWWHYNHTNAREYSLSNFRTECETGQ